MQEQNNERIKILLVILLAGICIYFYQNKDNIKYNLSSTSINIAQSLSKQKMYGASNVFYELARKFNPNLEFIDYQIAVNLRNECWGWKELTPKRKAKLELALKHLGKDYQKHPDNMNISDEYAFIYHQLEDFDKAIIYYNKGLSKNPNWEYGLQELAYIYCNIKFDYKKALEYQDRKMAIHVDRGRYGDYFSKAYILAKLDRNEEAVEYYKKYIADFPTHVAGLVNITNCEIKLKRYDDAEKHIDEGLKYAPEFSYLINPKITVLMHKHKFEEAKKLANTLIERNYYDDNAYWKLAEISRYEGNKEEAEKYYNKSKEVAQEYYDKYCKNPYDIGDYDGKCGNAYEFLKNFEKEKAKPLDFLNNTDID